MGSFASREGFSWVQLLLLTTLGLPFVTFVIHYTSGVLHRRNSRRRQDGIDVIVEREDAEIEYSFPSLIRSITQMS